MLSRGILAPFLWEVSMKLKSGILIIVLSVISCTSSLADITVTSRGAFSMMGMAMSDMTTVQMYHGLRSRSYIEEMQTSPIPTLPDQEPGRGITLIRLDQGATWVLSDKDSTFTETILAQVNDTTPSLVSDQQSLDSALYEKPEPTRWDLTSLIKADSVFLGMPCTIIKSSATNASSDTARETVAACELWTVADSDYCPEITTFDQELNELVGMQNNMVLEAYSGLLEYFSLTFADLGIDSLVGNPVKLELMVGSMISKEQADDIKSGPDEDMMPDSLTDSRDSIRAILIQNLIDNVQPGLMETLHVNYDIISIDTMTVLPDSLFEIPAGFTKR